MEGADLAAVRLRGRRGKPTVLWKPDCRTLMESFVKFIIIIITLPRTMERAIGRLCHGRIAEYNHRVFFPKKTRLSLVIRENLYSGLACQHVSFGKCNTRVAREIRR